MSSSNHVIRCDARYARHELRQHESNGHDGANGSIPADADAEYGRLRRHGKHGLQYEWQFRQRKWLEQSKHEQWY